MADASDDRGDIAPGETGDPGSDASDDRSDNPHGKTRDPDPGHGGDDGEGDDREGTPQGKTKDPGSGDGDDEGPDLGAGRRRARDRSRRSDDPARGGVRARGTQPGSDRPHVEAHGDRKAPRLGICCSGGGIRSAAFNLGALQSLDEAGLLRRADHLSAVSGGSYIASAYAVASRHSDPALLAERPAFAPGTPEERWVRNHCSYLANSFGDTLRVIAVALVGLLANLLFFATLLWTLARPLGWFYAWWQPGLRVPARCGPGLSAEAAEEAGCFAPAALTDMQGWYTATAALLVGGLALTLWVRMFQPGWPLRPTLRRVAGVLLVAGATVGLVAVALPELIVFTRNVLGGEADTGVVGTGVGDGSASDKGAANLGAIATFGGAATAVAMVVQLGRPLRAAATVGTRVVAGAERWTQRLSRGLRRLATTVLGALIGPAALAAVALLFLNGGAQSRRPSGGELARWAVAAGFTLVMLWFADVTSWSLHPLYKWRLARTFAVVRVPGGPGAPEGKAALLPYEKPLKLSEFARDQFPGGTDDRPAFPELLVCAAANVSDQGATPPGRSSLSFVFSPTTVGHPGRVVVTSAAPWWRRLLWPAQTEQATEPSPRLEMDTGSYEQRIGRRRTRDITLSAAVAMSGAAIAPSMGKMTRPVHRFLLALTNVRLGVWLPNPAYMPAGCSPGNRRSWPANPRQVRLLFEVAGRHRVRSRFLYVTDGGHVENLGLLELLRRGCTTIICLDAAGGSTTRFSTLGEAIALAASELNVRISIDPAVMGVRTDGLNACDHVTGTIDYPDGTKGTLVYGKALVTAGSPWDVRAYGSKDGQFPVHPTTDQLFSGETFDAYQALGRCVGAGCAAEVTQRAPESAGAAAPETDRPRVVHQVRVEAADRLPACVADIRAVAAAASELP